MNKNELYELNCQRLAEAAIILIANGAFPVIVCGLVRDTKQLIAFGFTGQTPEQIQEILKDYVDGMGDATAYLSKL